jgi:hypothetical protein
MCEGSQDLGVCAIEQGRSTAEIQLCLASEQRHRWQGLVPGLEEAGYGRIPRLGGQGKGQDEFHVAPPAKRCTSLSLRSRSCVGLALEIIRQLARVLFRVGQDIH